MHYSNCIELFPNVHDKDGGGGVGLPVAEDPIHLLDCILAHCIKVHITLDCETYVHILTKGTVITCKSAKSEDALCQCNSSYPRRSFYLELYP